MDSNRREDIGETNWSDKSCVRMCTEYSTCRDAANGEKIKKEKGIDQTKCEEMVAAVANDRLTELVD